MPELHDRSDETTRLWLAVAIFALIFAGVCTLNAVHIRFPIYWHPDEITKAVQLQTGTYNFHHPQLLLRLAMILHALLPLDDFPRDVVLAGRFVSIGATAIAVTAFGVLVMRRFGIGLGIVAAILIALTPTVFLNAHFFKEDATLLMGIALVMLAIQSVDIRPSRSNIFLLGLSVGLAASAKYIGIIMVVPAVAMLWSKRIRWIEGLGFALGAATVFVVINSAGIFGAGSLKTGFLLEVNHAITEHDGISWGPLSARTLISFWNSMPMPFIAIWIAGMLLGVWRWSTLREGDTEKRPTLTTMEGIIIFTPFLLLVSAQLSMVAIPRYVLPATALTIVAAVWITALVIDFTRTRPVRLIAIVLLATASATTIVSFVTAARVFADDSRIQLHSWIANHLPSDAKIATEFYAGLPTADRYAVDPAISLLQQSIDMPFFHLGMAGSIGRLRELGYTHMVLSSGNYDRFFDRTARLTTDTTIARKRFYQEVFATLTPIHKEPRLIDLDPMLRMQLLVYDIRMPPAAAERAPPCANGEGAR